MNTEYPKKHANFSSPNSLTINQENAKTSGSAKVGAQDFEDLARRFKQGLLDVELFDKADATARAMPPVDVQDAKALNARCVVGEIYDYRGLKKESQQMVVGGAEMWAQIQNAIPNGADPGALVLMREQIRFVANYARFYFYREQKFKLAKEYMLACREFVDRRLRRLPDFPCYGTLAQLDYYLGCALRKLGELDDADRHYGNAIDNNRARVEHKIELNPDAISYLDDAMSSMRRRTALCTGVGLGWTNYNRGHLTKALINNVMPAQTLLIGSKDVISKASLSLLRASIYRCLAKDAELSDKAFKDAFFSYKTFTTAPYCHETYATRAAFQLSLIALRRADLSQAEAWISTTQELAGNDERWLSASLVVRSRISLSKSVGQRDEEKAGTLKQALEEADRAVELIAGHEELLGKVDALIARGEVLLSLEDAEKAHQSFSEALTATEISRNPKVEGVIHLHLAQCGLLSGDLVSARRHFGRWKKLEVEVEHQFVHQLARRVKDELDAALRDFVVSVGVDSLNYANHNKNLRKWLIVQARDRFRGKRLIAQKLGVSPQTLANWEVELKAKVSGPHA